MKLPHIYWVAAFGETPSTLPGEKAIQIFQKCGFDIGWLICHTTNNSKELRLKCPQKPLGK